MIIDLSYNPSSRRLEILTSIITLKANAYSLIIPRAKMVIYTSVFMDVSIILSSIDSVVLGDVSNGNEFYTLNYLNSWMPSIV